MDVTGSAQAAAGLAILKSAIKQPELALDLLTRTLASMATPARPVAKAEVPANPALQGTMIDIQA